MNKKITFIIVVFFTGVFVFYFAHVASALSSIPLGCTDVDGNGCINEQDCGDPVNQPRGAFAGCSICPAGNCGGLPTEKSLGQSCSPSDNCGEFFCSSDTNTCAECDSSAPCPDGSNCSSGVCVVSGGNPPGEPCANNSQCASNNCVNNACAAAGSGGGGGGGGGGSGSGGGGGGSGGGGGIQSLPGEDLSIQDVFKIINGLACWLLRVAEGIMVIFLVWSGLRFMWARGNQAEFTMARKNFMHVLIGIVVIMGVYVIIATVANAVGADFSFIPLVC